MRQQRIEEEAVTDAAEREYQVTWQKTMMFASNLSVVWSAGQTTCGNAADETWLSAPVLTAGKERQAGLGGGGAHCETTCQETKEEGTSFLTHVPHV